jgi:hypothetical protein
MQFTTIANRIRNDTQEVTNMARRRQLKLSELQRAVDHFNTDFPVGSKVLLRRDNGDDLETEVIGAAEVLQGHSAVAWFEGITGCHDIVGRVRHYESPAISRLCRASADDCKMSLKFCTARDLPMLRQARSMMEDEGQRTKAKHIDARIRQLEKEQSHV